MIDADALHKIAAGELRPEGLVSLVVPHYETPELARLCLRAVRRWTDVPYEVLVVDNASGDGASLDYLRSVSWIRLFERAAEEVPASGPEAHATALELGLAEARGQYLLVMHTDTVARRDGWLGALRRPMESDGQLAVVGCDKLDAPGPMAAALKTLGDGKAYRRLACRLAGRPVPTRLQPKRRHARSFCALYRRQVLLDEALTFLPEPGSAAGETVWHELLARGYRGLLLPPRRMRELVEHVVHATAYLSADREIRTGRVRRRTGRRIERLLAEPWVRGLLADDTLDRR